MASKHFLKFFIFELLLLCNFCTFVKAQENNSFILEGIIVDTQTGSPIENVRIFSKNENQVKFSDIEGKFSFRFNEHSGDIFFSRIGYRTKQLSDYNLIKKFRIIHLTRLNYLLQEVTVYSNKKDDVEKYVENSLSMKSNLVAKISNVMPDVLRAFQAFPGISSNNEFSAKYNVRGGNKDENLILINETEVYEPFHLKGAPNASIGIFNVDLLQDVKLITGGFSAKYGDRLSSVADIKLRDGSRESYKGAVTLSMAYLDSYLEGPLLESSSFILSIRKTYMEYLLDLMNFGYEEIKTAKPSFYDIQGILSYDITPTDKLKLNFIYSGDNLIYNPPTTNIETQINDFFNGEYAVINTKSLHYENLKGEYFSTLIGLQSINFLSSNAYIKTNLSYYGQNEEEYRRWSTKYFKRIYSNVNYFDNKNREDLTQTNLKLKTLQAKSTLNFQYMTYLQNKLGISYKYLNYNDLFFYSKYAKNISNTLTYPDTLIEDYSYLGLDYRDDSLFVSSYKFGAFMENIFQVGKNLLINLSGRMDYFDLNKQLSFSPRLNIAYQASKSTSVRASYGKYFQSPIYSQVVQSEASDSNTKSQEAYHYIFGIEQKINLSANGKSKLSIKIDGFYKDYTNLISSFFSHSDRLVYSRKNDAVGYATGFELFISMKSQIIYSMLSYSFLNSKEDNLFDEYDAYPRLTAQKHTLAWLSEFRLGKNWTINTKFYYGSGYPFAEKELYYSIESDEYFWRNRAITTSYLPEYQRLDLRVSKIFIFKSYSIITFIEVSNLLNHKNIRNYDYTYDEIGNPKVNEVILWPTLPSFGIKVQF